MKRAEWFPNHQDHTIDRLAATVFAHESMLRMEVDSFKEVRRKELKAVLDSVGCISLKNEAWLMIEEFISGRVCISAKEVAASVRVAETLLDVVGDVNDVDVWDKFAGEWCEDVMHEHIYKGVWTWENAPERLKELKAFGEMVWDLEVALGL
ncbi:hypothetical protein HK101_011983 [Irineochytrium annulatum]|nr:hypothetical protein HK101_011983 [Irineochytrium annulatum]